MALYNADLKPLESGVPTHSYEHATRLFLDDNFRLTPKQKFLYYVCINVNQSLLQNLLGLLPNNGSEAVSSQTLIEQYETGLLAKRVELPRYNVNARTYNAYNRKNIVQNSLKYDPLNITFHDDAADTVTKFWNDIYTFYYRDSDYTSSTYQRPHKYQQRPSTGWGFSPRNGNLTPFIRDIQIFSLHNKRFTEYRLINPTITAWRSSEHDSASSNELMDATMTVEFETVKMFTGYINAVDVNGFGVIHYDNTPSPISNSTTNIYTDSGILSVLTEGTTDLARPDGSGTGSGLFGSLVNAYRFYNNLKDANFADLGQIALTQVGANILNDLINRAANNIIFPTSTGPTGTSASQVANTNIVPTQSPYSAPVPSNLATVNNQAAALTTGLGVSLVNNAVNNWSRGVQTNSSGPPVYPGETSVYQAVSGSQNIQIDGQTRQPVTEEITAYIFDAQTGQTVGQFTSTGSQNGGYLGEDDLLTNLKYITTDTDNAGNQVTRYQYLNGDQVTVGDANQVIGFVPGEYTNNTNLNTNPTPASEKAQNGEVSTGVEYAYNNGLLYTTGGTTSAYITNTLTGAAGTVAGLYAGQAVNSALQGVLPNNVIGQTVGAAVSGLAGVVVGRGVNNGLQPVVNYFSGKVQQGWNSSTGQVQNVTGNWAGSGGYNFLDPSQNVVNKVINGDGTYTYTYKNGETGTFNATTNDLISSTAATDAGFFSKFSSWFSGTPGTNQDTSVLSPGYGLGIWTDSFGNPVYTNTAYGADYAYTGGIPDSTSKYFIDGELDFGAWNAYSTVDLGNTPATSYDSSFLFLQSDDLGV